MLLVVRIVTIIVLAAWFVAGGYLVIAGLLQTPEADMDAVWIGAGVWLFIAGLAYLLYRGYKKKHAAMQWVAFILSILPALSVVILVWVLDALDL